MTKQERDQEIESLPNKSRFVHYWTIPGMKFQLDFKNITTLDEGEAMIRKMSDRIGIPYEKIISKTRWRSIVTARQCVIFVLRRNTNLTLKEIGVLFNRDHTTVIHSVSSVSGLLENSPDIVQMVSELRKIV
jgi:chromosomal replication initiation ATPase DnaA